jgi:hypothetical protein
MKGNYVRVSNTSNAQIDAQVCGWLQLHQDIYVTT